MFLEVFRVEHTRELGSHKAVTNSRTQVQPQWMINISLERNYENIHGSREMMRLLSECGQEQNHSRVTVGLGGFVLSYENL